MTARTYIELFEPTIRLTLHPVPGGYTVRDQHGADYVLAPCTFAFAARVLYAMREKRDALINEDSVLRWYRHERWLNHKSGEGEPRPAAAASGEDTCSSFRRSDPEDTGSSPSPEYSVRVPMADVIPIGRNT